MVATDLISIGEFAKRTGMTASALRFYDDAGVLHPERVDSSTGYRTYSESQLGRAQQLRQLRAIGMPLPAIGQFFVAGKAEAARLIDEQTARIITEAKEAQRVAALLKTTLSEDSVRTLCVLPGPVLSAAVDQVMAAASDDPEFPGLAGVRLEAESEAVILTATDRYRLAMRTLVPTRRSVGSWAGTLAGDDIRSALSQLRRSSSVAVEAGDGSIAFRTAHGVVARCRLIDDEFPDHRVLIASLPDVTHRLIIESQQTRKLLEHAPAEIGMRITDSQPGLLLSGDVKSLTGTATGADLTVWFELTTLYPAVSHALGSDIMIDLRGPDRPATVRSADDGDLIELVMPCRPASS
jgi:DNA polymerase-3 subunit beta